MKGLVFISLVLIVAVVRLVKQPDFDMMVIIVLSLGVFLLIITAIDVIFGIFLYEYEGSWLGWLNAWYTSIGGVVLFAPLVVSNVVAVLVIFAIIMMVRKWIITINS